MASKDSNFLSKACTHYTRNCEIESPCCKNFFGCRLCHDEICEISDVCSIIPMNRKEVQRIRCKMCQTIQKVNNKCENPTCDITFGSYYCSICRLWDNSKTCIYHCPDCGICRVGKGLNIDFFHCSTCNACLSMALKNKHTCVERSLESNCPLCLEYMFSSREELVIAPCGHGMHKSCWGHYTKSAWKCPICAKPLYDVQQIMNSFQAHLPWYRNGQRYKTLWIIFGVICLVILLHYLC